MLLLVNTNLIFNNKKFIIFIGGSFKYTMIYNRSSKIIYIS